MKTTQQTQLVTMTDSYLECVMWLEEEHNVCIDRTADDLKAWSYGKVVAVASSLLELAIELAK